jgi:hypothetical protein
MVTIQPGKLESRMITETANGQEMMTEMMLATATRGSEMPDARGGQITRAATVLVH